MQVDRLVYGGSLHPPSLTPIRRLARGIFCLVVIAGQTTRDTLALLMAALTP